MQNGDKAVDAVDVEETWQLLAAHLGSQLIDVRTRAAITLTRRIARLATRSVVPITSAS